MCYDLIVICYLLFVMIAHAQGCLVGANRHVLRPYCYLLFVICYDCARQCAPLLKEKNVSRFLRFHRNRRPFALQSTRDTISIVGSDVSRCVTADSDHAGNASDRPQP